MATTSDRPGVLDPSELHFILQRFGMIKAQHDPGIGDPPIVRLKNVHLKYDIV